ncbi:hypothetical protein, variant [Sphaeroforma arctica JP610]|uniref:PRA1 family protein n=1 Tax=Sphaeroforma arctica JP610 TaxID=667725 RepID=A0A0L0FC35_9EUKA|nr:hypothetical protein, variant [Sphaeroforma arctica JP610]KNC74289.1 hypothetical protein, variant [Sphaeroforma arctica JP610]|eukprot:XP_014148191.1 hypothetical protein, variant [Sphaeroforma arctica JP610]
MSVRDWNEMTDLAPPSDADTAKQRLGENVQYFSANYAVIMVAVAIICMMILGSSLGVGLAIALLVVLAHAAMKPPSLKGMAVNTGNDMRDSLKAKMNARNSMKKSKRAD